MALQSPELDLGTLLDELFGSVPLFFIQEFLRSHKTKSKRIRIGTTRRDVRANLQDAIVSNRIGLPELQTWLAAVAGWGKQHLYIAAAGRGALAYSHLLNRNGLTGFLKRKGFIPNISPDSEPASTYVLDEIAVDDEIARISWKCHSLSWERHEELDEQREFDDGEYEFRAYRKLPRSDVSRLIIRKTDGIVLSLVNLPIGADHDAIRTQMSEVGNVLLAPLKADPIHLAPIISALDQGAVADFGPRAKRDLAVEVSPTQARFRTDGAQVEFKSTRESLGYTESDAVRRVRSAMQITKFVGQSGKFRLNFVGPGHRPHDMVVSFTAMSDRIFLFSRMTDLEVSALVDQLLPFGQQSGSRRR